jgi:hypothetical protein
MTRRTLAVAVALTMAACSGSAPSQLPPTPPTATPTAIPPAPPSPPAKTVSCPKGDVDAVCFRPAETYFQEVDAAIDQLIQQRPDIFNLQDSVGPGAYRVLKVDDYFAGVIRNLEQQGFCAARLGDDLQLKETNEYSEEYDILLSSSYIRRGLATHTRTCRPAVFPLEAADVIARVPIFLWGYHECPDPQRDMPDFALRQIPMGCIGLITATPKDRNNHDVDARIHGPDILWEITAGEGRLELMDFPGVPFNKKVKTVRTGPFTLCATVQGVQGCYNFAVIP